MFSRRPDGGSRGSPALKRVIDADGIQPLRDVDAAVLRDLDPAAE